MDNFSALLEPGLLKLFDGNDISRCQECGVKHLGHINPPPVPLLYPKIIY